MSSWPARALLLAGAAALATAIPASSQEREAPESLLPPGFGDPGTLPPPENKAQPAPRPSSDRDAAGDHTRQKPEPGSGRCARFRRLGRSSGHGHAAPSAMSWKSGQMSRG